MIYLINKKGETLCVVIKNKGVIYILINPSLPQHVKIGYIDYIG